MTLTRTQAGKTPKQTQHPGYVETPGRKGRPRKSNGHVVKHDSSDAPDSSPESTDKTIEATPTQPTKEPQKTLNMANAHLKSGTAETTEHNDEKNRDRDQKVDNSGHFEFGGSFGVSAMMIGFPLLMYYMWIGATYYDGKFPMPARGESASHFFRRMGALIYTGAFPSLKAWAMYWTFFVVEGLFYVLMPGVWTKGKPLPHENGHRLDYYCSGMWSWWSTITIIFGLHFSGLFRLYEIIDEFGPLLSVAIISGYLVSIMAYVSALYRGAQHRMTGYPVYDFFMGAELNPRMFTILDFKMFFEVRLPWFILFLLSSATAARQYEKFGYVSGEIGFLILAHFLYANACAKAEESIVTTWDIYYEKWGFMLIFWNLAGVPLSYCHCTLYLANHEPSEYRWNRYALVALYISYLFVYWIWDTTNSQKNKFRQREQGNIISRKSFPQLPWGEVKNPKIIRTENGGTILAGGWYGYARKIHYTCDLFFALSWALITGFRSPFPWFYPTFFACMISHRALRDIQRCRRVYGKAWEEYERQVPYLFIPYVF